MIDLLICGIGGKMGANVLSLAEADGEINVVCGVDLHAPAYANVPSYAAFNEVKEHVDVVIDFSSPAVLNDELKWAKERGCAVVLGATGYTADDLKTVERYAKEIPVFKTGNFSVGVNLLVKLARRTAEALGENFDVEIVERHHNQKVDAPSGTALMLAEGVNEALGGGREFLHGREGIVGKRGNEIGIHAVRGGTIVGEHEVMFAGEDEIVTLSHSARSKRVFAAGAVRAAKWIVGKGAGKYDMNDVLENI